MTTVLDRPVWANQFTGCLVCGLLTCNHGDVDLTVDDSWNYRLPDEYVEVRRDRLDGWL